MHWQLGEFAEARPLYERALAIDEQLSGPDHPDVAHVLNNIGLLLRNLGDYAGAQQHLERALAIREAALGPEHPDVAHSLNDLAGLLKEMGDFTAAKPLFERAVAIDEKALGSNHPVLALHLTNLGIGLMDIGATAAARAPLERALAIHAQGETNPRWAADAEASLADLLSLEGDHAGAIPHYERAVSILERVLGPDHPDLALKVSLLAMALAKTGALEQSRLLAIRSLTIRERAYGSQHPDVAGSLSGLAHVLARLGKDREALSALLRAEGIGREHLRLTAQALSERQALAYAATRRWVFDLMLSLPAQSSSTDPSPAGDIADAVIRSRALVLDEMASRHRTLVDADNPQIARAARELAAARQRLANLLVRGAEHLSSEQYRKVLDQARQERERAESALAEGSTAFRATRARRQVGLAEVLGALPAAGALVAYVRYDRHDWTAGDAVGRPADGKPSYLAFMVRGGETEPAVFRLGSADEIDRKIGAWRRRIEQEALAAGPASKRSETAYRQAALELRRSIWDPLAQQLEGIDLVFVVPDGALHLVNLAALPAAAGGYMIESGPLIHYLSAERDLVPSGGTWSNGGLLALGAPDFDQSHHSAARAGFADKIASKEPASAFRGMRSSCGAFQSMRFEPLPAAALEVKEIVTVWNRAAPPARAEGSHSAASGAGPTALTLIGPAAEESSFKDRAAGMRMLHLATHGFFLGGRCGSALDAVQPPGTERTPVAGENPLLLAGLALAGANRRQTAGADEEDGILTAEEIAALNLERVDWAVLSGCDTGVGEIQAGEGVFGLRRVFQIAGVKSVIMSLWPVEDETARRWMTSLYEARLLDDKSTAECVREASLELLRRRRAAKLSTHPFYWAGFIAAGDWR